jgi:ribosomal protein S18 acetylase RimI-like enzyme
VIRRASLSDVATIYHIERKCFGRRSFSKAHIIWLLKNPSAVTYIYYDDDRAVAAIMLKHEGNVARVVSIGVIPGYRRKGIGKELMALGEEIMRGKGAKVMKLEVSVKNEAAITFYRRLGYEMDGLLKGYYSWGEDAYIMRKPLEAGRNV